MCRACECRGEMRSVFMNLPPHAELRAVAAAILRVGMCQEAVITLEQVARDPQLLPHRPPPVEQDTPGGGR